MVRAVLRCLRSPRACAVRLVQRRSRDYRYFHIQKKMSVHETRRLQARGRGDDLLDDALLPRRRADEGGR